MRGGIKEQNECIYRSNNAGLYFFFLLFSFLSFCLYAVNFNCSLKKIKICVLFRSSCRKRRGGLKLCISALSPARNAEHASSLQYTCDSSSFIKNSTGKQSLFCDTERTLTLLLNIHVPSACAYCDSWTAGNTYRWNFAWHRLTNIKHPLILWYRGHIPCCKTWWIKYLNLNGLPAVAWKASHCCTTFLTHTQISFCLILVWEECWIICSAYALYPLNCFQWNFSFS